MIEEYSQPKSGSAITEEIMGERHHHDHHQRKRQKDRHRLHTPVVIELYDRQHKQDQGNKQHQEKWNYFIKGTANIKVNE
jgi:hypothetical protein